MQKYLKYLVPGLILIFVVTFLAMMGTKVPAATVVAQESSLRVSIRGEGQTRVRDSYVITSPIAGEIERVMWRVGDSVQRGTTLFRVLPGPDSEQSSLVSRANYEASLARQRQAQTLVEDAQAVKIQSDNTLKRQQVLAEQDIVTPEQLERAELSAFSAGRQLVAAEETLIAASADVIAAQALMITDDEDRTASGLDVKAPVTGRILRIFERSERVVPPGAPVLEVGDTGQQELVVDVLSEDAVRIRAGNTVEITRWGGKSVLRGIVKLVEPAAFTKFSALGVEEQRVNVIIDLLDAPAELGVGFRVEASITVWEADSVITIPVSSVFQEDSRWFTFVVVEDRVEKRGIIPGERSSEMIQVLQGIQSGEEIVQYPSTEIFEGTIIKR